MLNVCSLVIVDHIKDLGALLPRGEYMCQGMWFSMRKSFPFAQNFLNKRQALEEEAVHASFFPLINISSIVSQENQTIEML